METLRIPHLRKTETSQQLIVDGKAFLIRGAELQNSSFSSAKHMSSIWQKMIDMNVNTILGSVSWEMIEPQEGMFDFSVVDQLIKDARRHGLRLILLWFGSWKNGISTYAPSWVKMNPVRFPRVVIRGKDGVPKVTEILSCVHGHDAKLADAKALRELMRHVKAVDEAHSTVIMVQVENEVGILGDSRDRSEAADEVFDFPVPGELIDLLKQDWAELHPDLQKRLARSVGNASKLEKGRSWTSTFGSSAYTDELFMAFHYADYVSTVAHAGKEAYALPLFANFWLNYGEDDAAGQYPVLAGGGNLPGDYPSGGAVSGVVDIWMQFAQGLDFLAPDTYLNDYHRVCATYRHRDQPLFIPEQRRDEYGARRMWAAVGSYLALGASPFALDTLESEACAYTKHYALLAKVSDIVLDAQTRNHAITGFFFDEVESTGRDPSPPTIAHMGGYEIRIERAFTTGAPGPGYGIVIHLETRDDYTAKFLLVGAGFQVKFRSIDSNAAFTGILDFVERDRDAVSGEWETLRRLNGDETRSGQQAIMPNEHPDDGAFPIAITIPAKTKIADCTVYRVK